MTNQTELRERIARRMSYVASDWLHNDCGDDDHALGHTNWKAYLDDADAVLALVSEQVAGYAAVIEKLRMLPARVDEVKGESWIVAKAMISILSSVDTTVILAERDAEVAARVLTEAADYFSENRPIDGAVWDAVGGEQRYVEVHEWLRARAETYKPKEGAE